MLQALIGEAEAVSTPPGDNLGDISILRALQEDLDTPGGDARALAFAEGIKFEMGQVTNHSGVAFQCSHGDQDNILAGISNGTVERGVDYLPVAVNSMFRAKITYAGPGSFDTKFRSFDFFLIQPPNLAEYGTTLASRVPVISTELVPMSGSGLVFVDPADIRCSCGLVSEQGHGSPMDVPEGPNLYV
jgi:hypothetical protein